MSNMEEILAYAANFKNRVAGPRTEPGSMYPMCSDAAGINPDHRVEQMAADKKMGVETHYNREGQAVFTDKGHRKRYCEAHGMYDRNGSYGDPQRR